MLKFCAYLEPHATNIIDHLAPLCDLFKAPIITSDESNVKIAKKYYPNLDIINKDLEAMSPDYLTKYFDVIMHSTFWNKKRAKMRFLLSEKKYKKQLRFLFTPHGNSDKGHFHPIMENFAEQDISLIYGNKMLDFIKEKNDNKSINNYIIIGNIRYNYYLKSKSFFDSIIQNQITKNFDSKKKIILYAPTWKDNENSSSFFDINDNMINKLSKKYNLIIKLHPRLEEHFLGRIIHFKEKYKNQKNIKILSLFPLIYPLLNVSDLYLGDYSSVGYDFLKYNRPMFFFDVHKLNMNHKMRYLHNYGINIAFDQLDQINQIIEKGIEKENYFKPLRQKLYNYTFESKFSIDDIKNNIIQMCKS